MQLQVLLLTIGAAGALASPATHWNALNRRNASSTACAEVSASSAAQVATAPTATPTVGAQVAYDCLTSVPLHASDALELMDAILPFVAFQTDLSYLKNPPDSYLEPAVDINAALATVISNIQTGVYATEYEFQADLFRTFNLAHDGHFRFLPDLLSSALAFRRGVAVVSVSSDGSEVPKVYVLDDIMGASNTTASISPLATVNNVDVYTFIEELSQLGALQDPDALYNSMFFSPAFYAEDDGDFLGYFYGSGRFGYIYPGVSTTITFENGTSKVYETFASVIGNFNGVTDADSMFNTFCSGALPPSNSTSNSTTTSVSATTTATATATGTSIPTPTASTSLLGYPEPVVISPEGIVSGYYLPGTDVAVLALLTFEEGVPADYQAAIQTFIADAKAAGKTKMVIDVSANGGGYILLGYDAFRQFFPQIIQDGYTRFRDSELLQVIAQEATVGIPEDFNPDTAGSYLIESYESIFNYRYDYNLTDQPFLSYGDKFDIHEYNGDNFTNILRWNLDDPLTTVNTTFGLGMEITGYGTRQNFTQPFAAEDIIIMYDGYCASTCTLFSEFMRLQGGVKSIALGGRSSTASAGDIPDMQAIGGVKGANNYPFSYISSAASIAYYAETPEQRSHANSSYLVAASNTLAASRSTDNSINVRDNILPANLDDGLPAQFVYEAADCRLFYTAAMLTDVEMMWRAVADAAWGGAPCVAGGLPAAEGGLKRRAPTKSQLAAARKRGVVVRGEGEGPVEKDDFWAARHGRKVPS